MPKINQYASEYAARDFSKALRVAMAEADTNWNELSQATGISGTTMYRKKENPELFTLKDMQKIMSAIPLPGEAVLSMITIYRKRD